MSEDQNQVVTLKVRVSPEFREKIATIAKENNRSMNAEICTRLEESFSPNSLIDDQKRQIDLLTHLLKENSKMMNDIHAQLDHVIGFNKSQEQ